MKRQLQAVAAASLILGGALTTTPLASAEPKDGRAENRQCFYARNISNYTTVGDRLIYLRVGVADVYRLELMNDCPELSFRQSIQFTRADPSTNICSAIDLTIHFNQPGAHRICPVSDLRKLTLAEVAALPRRVRP